MQLYDSQGCNDLREGALFGIADVRVPDLLDFTDDGFVGHANLQNVVVFELNAFHG